MRRMPVAMVGNALMPSKRLRSYYYEHDESKRKGQFCHQRYKFKWCGRLLRSTAVAKWLGLVKPNLDRHDLSNSVSNIMDHSCIALARRVPSAIALAVDVRVLVNVTARLATNISR